MFSALVGSLVFLAKKPFVLVSGLVFGLLQFLLVLWTGNILFGFLFDVLLAGRVPEAPLQELPARFFSLYPGELTALLFLLLATLFLNLALFFSAARFAVLPSPKPMDVLLEPARHLPLLLSSALFLFLAGLAFFSVSFSLAVFFLSNPPIFFFLLAVWFFLSLYLALRFLFFIPAVARAPMGVRQGLLESWSFSKKHFWSALGIAFLLLVLWLFVSGAGLLISGGIQEERLAGLAAEFWSGLSTVWLAVFLTQYYLKKQDAGLHG